VIVVVAAGLALVALLLFAAAFLMRQRRLQHRDVVAFGGNPYVVVAITRGPDIDGIGFEPLDEYLTRTIVRPDGKTLAELMLRAGWKAPKTPDTLTGGAA
jgi:hypothetical protein